MIPLTDWWANGIAIADIVVTIIVGVVITFYIDRNYNKSRYIREYFIGELKDIKNEYASLFRDVYSGEISSKMLLARLKIFSIRINNFDAHIHKTYKIKNTLLKDAHSKFQQEITFTDEFNEQFKKTKIVFEANTISQLSQLHAEIIKSITQRVLDINSANQK